MIYSYKNGQKAIAISTLYNFLKLWEEKCNKSGKEVAQKWQEIFDADFQLRGNRGQLIKLPKVMNPKLAYLAGWLCGDGHFANYDKHYLIKISEKSADQLNFLSRLNDYLFEIKPKIHRMYQGGLAMLINSKPLYRFFTKTLGLKVGEIPKFADYLDDINLRNFICGVFDSEGYVSNTRPRITISQARKKFLIKLIGLSSKIGIKFNGPTQHKTHLGTWYSIRIERGSEIQIFSKLIGSHHIDKSRKLANLISQIRNKNSQNRLGNKTPGCEPSSKLAV